MLDSERLIRLRVRVFAMKHFRGFPGVNNFQDVPFNARWMRVKLILERFASQTFLGRFFFGSKNVPRFDLSPTSERQILRCGIRIILKTDFVFPQKRSN